MRCRWTGLLGSPVLEPDSSARVEVRTEDDVRIVRHPLAELQSRKNGLRLVELATLEQDVGKTCGSVRDDKGAPSCSANESPRARQPPRRAGLRTAS